MSHSENPHYQIFSNEIHARRIELVPKDPSSPYTELVLPDETVSNGYVVESPEQRIQDVIRNHFPELFSWFQNRHKKQQKQLLTQFCRRFFQDFFFADRVSTANSILKGFAADKQRVSEEYIGFVQYALFEAAAVGFLSVAEPFSSARQGTVLKTTGRSLFDARNILALRIYLADILSQITPLRVAQLEFLISQRPPIEQLQDGGSARANHLRVSKMPALFGATPEIHKGQMINLRQLEIDSYSRGRYTYTRQDLPIYLPDMEQVQALLLLGDALGRQRMMDRDHTYPVIGGMDTDKAKIIFPDLFDHQKKVDTIHVEGVQIAFGIPYESARSLFEREFNHENRN